MNPKFGIGDKVKIIIGSIYWVAKEGYAEESRQMEKWEKETRYRLLFNEHKSFPLPPLDLNAKPKNILSEKGSLWECDKLPQIVGEEVLIDGLKEVQGKITYSVSSKNPQVPHAWYFECQLEMVNKNLNWE